MTDVTIRRVPDDMLRTLKIRAAEAGQSLQTYLWNVVAREAARPTLAEVTARAETEASASISVEDVIDVIDEERSRR